MPPIPPEPLPPPTLVKVEGGLTWLACGACKWVRTATGSAGGQELFVRDHYPPGRGSVECPGSGARYEPPIPPLAGAELLAPAPQGDDVAVAPRLVLAEGPARPEGYLQ